MRRFGCGSTAPRSTPGSGQGRRHVDNEPLPPRAAGARCISPDAESCRESDGSASLKRSAPRCERARRPARRTHPSRVRSRRTSRRRVPVRRSASRLPRSRVSRPSRVPPSRDRSRRPCSARRRVSPAVREASRTRHPSRPRATTRRPVPSTRASSTPVSSTRANSSRVTVRTLRDATRAELAGS